MFTCRVTCVRWRWQIRTDQIGNRVIVYYDRIFIAVTVYVKGKHRESIGKKNICVHFWSVCIDTIKLIMMTENNQLRCKKCCLFAINEKSHYHSHAVDFLNLFIFIKLKQKSWFESLPIDSSFSCLFSILHICIFNFCLTKTTLIGLVKSMVTRGLFKHVKDTPSHTHTHTHSPHRTFQWSTTSLYDMTCRILAKTKQNKNKKQNKKKKGYFQNFSWFPFDISKLCMIMWQETIGKLLISHKNDFCLIYFGKCASFNRAAYRCTQLLLLFFSNLGVYLIIIPSAKLHMVYKQRPKK